MQRGPCKSRVTVTSAHAVLFRYNGIARQHNYFSTFGRYAIHCFSISVPANLNILTEEQWLSIDVEHYILFLITQYWDLLIDAQWNEHKQLTGSTTYFMFSEIKNMTRSLKDGHKLSSGISRWTLRYVVSQMTRKRFSPSS